METETMTMTNHSTTEESYVTLAQLEKLWLRERRKKESNKVEDTLPTEQNQTDHENKQGDAHQKQSAVESSDNWGNYTEEANEVADASTEKKLNRSSRRKKPGQKKGENEYENPRGIGKERENPRGIENVANPEESKEAVKLRECEIQGNAVIVTHKSKRTALQWRRKEDSAKSKVQIEGKPIIKSRGSGRKDPRHVVVAKVDPTAGVESTVGAQKPNGSFEIVWKTKSSGRKNDDREERAGNVVVGGHPTAEIERKLEVGTPTAEIERKLEVETPTGKIERKLEVETPTGKIESKVEAPTAEIVDAPTVDKRVLGGGNLGNYGGGRRDRSKWGSKVESGRTKRTTGMIWVRKGASDTVTG